VPKSLSRLIRRSIISAWKTSTSGNVLNFFDFFFYFVTCAHYSDPTSVLVFAPSLLFVVPGTEIVGLGRVWFGSIVAVPDVATGCTEVPPRGDHKSSAAAGFLSICHDACISKPSDGLTASRVTSSDVRVVCDCRSPGLTRTTYRSGIVAQADDGICTHSRRRIQSFLSILSLTKLGNEHHR
jgi:hypothetical protein